MARFTDIDLARLPPLPESADQDAIRLARLAELKARLAGKGIPFDTDTIETEPLVIIQGAGAYREVMLIARQDEAVRALLVATSWGVYLDHLGATQTPAVARLPLVVAPRAYATNPEDWESDEAFRRRIQLAPETLSAAGPEGAYLGYALAVPGVKMASVYGPMEFGGDLDTPFTTPGRVDIPIVAAAGDGAASSELVAAVQAACRAEDRRPLADWVVASAAEIVPYAIEAVLKVGPGVDRSVVQPEAASRLTRQALAQHRPGAPQLRRMLFGAAFVHGSDGVALVRDVELIQPAADVNPGPITPASRAAAYRAPYCTGVSVTVEVVDD